LTDDAKVQGNLKYDQKMTAPGQITGVPRMRAICPLWVKSGHFAMSDRCPLYPKSGHSSAQII